MDKINWIQIIVGFLGGGAVGAVIKQYFDNAKNKIQQIEYFIHLYPVHFDVQSDSIKSKLILNNGLAEFEFSNISAGTFEIINKGNQDYSEFNFGLTLDKGNELISFTHSPVDRHHIAEHKKEPSLTQNLNKVDLILKPFNRNDSYSFDVLITSKSNHPVSSRNMKVSSALPIKLFRPPNRFSPDY
jgi:hypothetical protein